MKTALARFLFWVGLAGILLATFLMWQRVTPRRLSFNLRELPSINSQAVAAGKPMALVIGDLGIKLPIFPAKLENNKWETTTKGVSYLVGSPLPGEVGNSILYGHNWPSLLGRLTQAKLGQEVSVVFDDGSRQEFIITSTVVVSPDQSQVLEPTSDVRLTIYTCTGILDRERFVVTATGESSNPS